MGTRALRMSARNLLKGTVESVREGVVTAEVKIRVDSPSVVTAVITRESVKDLEIKPGDKVVAVIKATEVMIGKE